MEIILKKDVQGVGHRNDTVEVKPGYGRNYLIPQGLAMVASEINKKIAAENIRQSAHKVARLKKAAEELAIQLGQLDVQITVKAGEKGQLFGSITPSQIAEALKKQGILVDSKDIHFERPVKALGNHDAMLSLHREVTHSLKFSVVKDTS